MNSKAKSFLPPAHRAGNYDILEYYKATLSGWISTKLEKDKSILTLSSAAIGLLITLLAKFGVSSELQFLLYIFGIIAFLLSAASIVFIFGQNAKHLEKIHSEEETNSPLLSFFDKFASFLFITGLVILFSIGLLVSVNSYNTQKEDRMSKESPKKERTDESFNGFSKLNPKPISPGPDTGSSKSKNPPHKNESTGKKELRND